MADRDPRAGEPFTSAQVRVLLAGKVVVERREIEPQPVLLGIESFGESWAWGERGEDEDWFSGVTRDQLTGKSGLLFADEPSYKGRCPFGQTGERRLIRITGRRPDLLTVEQTIRVEQNGGVWWWVREWRRCND